MKRILKFYLPVLIVFLSLSFLLIVYLIKNHSALISYPFGYSRLHSRVVESTVIVDGTIMEKAKVFKMDDDRFLVYAPNSGQNYPVIIVDKKQKDIANTDAADGDYELIFDRYLFQSDTAYDAYYASDAGWEYNPNLSILDSRISYTTPKMVNGKLVTIKVEILFKGE